MKIAFIWFGITGRYGHWEDGLYYAMKELEKEHEVTYHEPTSVIPEDAIVLFWEALSTKVGKDSNIFDAVTRLPNKKALLFAGGVIKKEWTVGFDHIFVESKLNKDEFGGKLEFELTLLDHVGDTAWVEPTIIKIKEVLDKDEIPEANSTCEHCSYYYLREKDEK